MATFIDRLLILIDAKTENATKQINNLSNLFMGLGLSLLFTMMAVQRFFQTMLLSLFQTFLSVEGETGIVNNSLGNLMAALEFLKYSLIDAFVETGLLDKWINRIDSLINYFNSLDTETKAWIVDFLVNGFLISSILMVIGQMLLFLLGPLAALKFLVGGSLGAFVLMLGKLSLIGIALLVIGFLFKMLSDKVGGVGNAFKAMYITVKYILAILADLIIGLLVTPLNIVISLINAIIKGYNALASVVGGPTLKTIQSIPVGVLSSGVKAERDQLMNEIRLQKTFGTSETIPSGSTVINNLNVEGSVLSAGDLVNLINNETSFFNGSPQT